MRAVAAIAGTALRRYFRDRSSYFFVFVFPIALILLIGLQFGGDPGLGEVALVGHGPRADYLARELRDASLTVTPFDDDSARELVARGRISAVVEVPSTGDAVTVTPGTFARGQAVTAAIRQAVAALGDRESALAALAAAGVHGSAAATAYDRVDDVGPRFVVKKSDDPGADFDGLGQFDLGAAQQFNLFVFLAALTGAVPLIQSRELRVTQRELTTPISAFQLVVGEGLGRFVIALIQGVYIAAGTAVLFGVRWGNLLATLATMVLFCAVAAALGVLIGSTFDNQNAATGIGIGIGLVAAAIGGSMVPLELFPGAIVAVARFTPHYWAYQAFATIQRHDGTVADIGGPLLVLGVMLVVLIPLGATLLRRAVTRP